MSVSFKKYLCKILIISMVFNLLYFASATFTYAATSYNSNLIVNGNAESGDFTGWSGDVSAPDFTVVFPPDVGYSTSPDGGNVFDYYPLNSIPTPQSVSIHQIIDISDLASDISSGLVEFNLSGYIRRYFATSSAIIRVEQLDGSSNPIIGQSTEISNDAPNASEDWQMKSANHILLHQDTRQLRLTLDATIEDQSSSMDFIEFDGINLQLNKLTPSMTVEGNSTTINSGDITPSLTDHTSFGEATLASATIDRIFRIKSNGDATLSLTGTPMVSITGTHASDFTVIDQPSSSINATDYSDFTVRFDPSDIGVRTATISIANNSSITPYTFSIEGTGLPEALVIASANPADGTVSTVYAGHTFTSTGGTGAKTYAVTAGTLPSGLSLASNGTLTGTPTTDGSYNFTVTVTDSASTPETDSHAYTMDVLPEALVIASANPADGTVSTVYVGHTFTSTGGTGAKTYAVTAGTLPSGLSLASNGALTGTPTTDGSYNFTVTVTDSASTPETDSHTYTMDILPEGTSVNYLVTYNGNTSNRGSVPIDGNIYQTNDSVTVLGNIGALGKTGHSFAGWNTAADGSGINYSSGNSFVIGSSNVTLYARWTENTSSGGNTSSGRTSTTAQPNQEALIVIVNGQEEKAGKETMTTEAGKSTITVEVDNELIENKINNTIGTANIIQFPIADTKAEVVKVELTGDIVKNLEENTFNVSIKRDNIEYVIPAEEFTISKVAENLGVAETDLETIKIEVKITKLDEEVVEKYNEVAKANGAELIFPPVSFEVVAKTENVDGTIASVNISKFNNYVQRVMEIQEGIDPSKITTGIVFNLDGTYSHVPTEVFQKEGKWYAQLSSLTNSNYSVIWNPVTVNSVEEHWAKEAVNDMASRLIILDQGNFEPNEAITRADFAEYIVRALGIYREEATYENMFLDVRGDGVQTPAILIASENKIVAGYSDGTFRPNELITREEAMTMYHRAMKVTKLVGSDVTRYQNYKDFENVSDWAQGYVKEVIAANVFNGTDATMISPKSNLTYAEAAQAIRNLLVESKLINK